MARACEICHKGPIFGHNISHSNKATNRKWSVNLQRVKARTENGGRRIWVCTRCLRSGRVQKAV
ncbi:MAG: 50S ribosomal protein L28 [Candidatus Aminicenantes bacterium]|nr:50S ribosomal protein L28 [Candidatus Aminicenantes bacterium]